MTVDVTHHPGIRFHSRLAEVSMATIRCARLDSILRIYIERIEYSIKNLRNTQQNTVNKKKRDDLLCTFSAH